MNALTLTHSERALIPNQIEVLQTSARAFNVNPDEMRLRDAIIQQHRTIIDDNRLEDYQLSELTNALRERILKALRGYPSQNGIDLRLESGSPGENIA